MRYTVWTRCSYCDNPTWVVVEADSHDEAHDLAEPVLEEQLREHRAKVGETWPRAR